MAPQQKMIFNGRQQSSESKAGRHQGHTSTTSWLEGLLRSPVVLAAPISTSSLFMPVPAGVEGGRSGSGGGDGGNGQGETRDSSACETTGEEGRAMRGAGLGEEGGGRRGGDEGGSREVCYSRAPPSPRHIRGPSPPPSTPARLAHDSVSETLQTQAGDGTSVDAQGAEKPQDGAGGDESDHEVWC